MKTLMLLLAAMMIAAGCGTSKEVLKAEDITTLTMDSSSSGISKKLEGYLGQELRTLERRAEESKWTGVLFADPVPCPPTVIDSSCREDSMAKIIRAKDLFISTLSNSVYIHANGAIEANGAIRQANADISRIVQENDDLFKRNLKLAETTDSVVHRLQVREEDYSRLLHRKKRNGWVMFLLGVALATVWWKRAWLRKILLPKT